MGDGDDGAGVGLEVLLQPEHRLGVEVVGGLVEQEQVGLLQEQLAQRDPATLSTGEVGHGRVRRRAAQGVHRLLELAVEVPRVGVVDVLLELAHLGEQGVVVGVGVGHLGRDLVVAVELGLDLAGALLDVAEDGLVLVERRLLQEDADARARSQAGLAVGRLVESGHDLEDRRLAGAVGADHADLRAGVEGHRDVIEDDLLVVRLAGTGHGVDVLGHAQKAIGRRRGTESVSAPADRHHRQAVQPFDHLVVVGLGVPRREPVVVVRGRRRRPSRGRCRRRRPVGVDVGRTQVRRPDSPSAIARTEAWTSGSAVRS